MEERAAQLFFQMNIFRRNAHKDKKNDAKENTSNNTYDTQCMYLDDIEFDLPPVGTPPTLESILNEPDDESLSDEELSGQLSNDANDCTYGQNSQWNVDSPDTASINSLESSGSSKTSSRRQRRSPKLFLKHGAIIKHVVLRGVTTQMVSASERVKAGKPSAMAVSNMIAIGTTHGIVLIFDVKQVMKWCLGNIEVGEQHGSVSALSFNADCSRLLVGHAKGLISKWDLQTGKLLQNIVDVHPIGTAVLHIYFIDEHTRAIFSDSGGSVFELNFKKSIGGRSCESQCIFSGSRGEVCTLQPLIPNPHHNHPLKPYDLLALATMSKIIVIALRPSIQVLFSHPLKNETEINRRIGIAKDAFNNMANILTSRNLKIETKKRLVKCYIWSTLLYGAETWTLTKIMMTKIEAFEMWIYRRMLKISYTEHRTNEFVLRKIEAKRSLMNTIKKRKCTYFGHIMSKEDGLQRLLLEDNSDVEYEPMESDNETIDSYESDDVLSEHEGDSVMLSDSWKRIADIFSDCRPNSLPELVRNFSGINPALNCNANNSILENFKKFITNDADNSTLPLLCWQFVIIQMTNSARVIDPVLTFGRENVIYFFQATDTQPKSINFIPLQKMKLPYTILNFAWLNSRTFAILDTNEVLHVIDVRSEEPLEVVDLASVHLVYNSSHFKALSTGGNVSKAMALVGERACYESIKVYNGQLLILGTRSIHVMTIRSWNERIDYLANRNKFKECLILAQSFYEESAKAVVGLTGRREQRRKCVTTKMEELIIRYADSIITHLKPADSSETNLEDYFRDCIPICVEFCFYLNQIDLLFDDIYEKIGHHSIAKKVFLESLEPFILNNKLSNIPPLIAQEFVAHYEACELFLPLEACIIHLDITSLDIHQVMTLCWKHNLYDSIIYIYNKGMLDFVTPLEELIVILVKAVATGKQLSDENIRLGNKLFVYISCCLVGRGYPRGELSQDLIPQVQSDVFQIITAVHSTKVALSGEEVFPYLKTLLKFDTREFLNVLSMAFEESSCKSSSSGDDRQTLVDILLRIMVNSPDFTPSQVGALFTFLARQLAKPDNVIIVDHMLFEQVLEYLTSVGDESRIEERQQALLDLYQAGGLAQIDDKKLLMLAEKAHFYRMCEVLYEKDRSYDKILACYLQDQVRQSQVFIFIRQINSSTKYTDSEKKSVEREIAKRIKEFVDIDNKKTAKMVISLYPQNLPEIIVKLQDQPDVQYNFLGGVFEYQLVLSISISDASVKPVIGHPSNGKEKEGDFQPVIEAAVHETYIELMCQYNPNNVAQHVKNNEGYRLEETLDICRKYNILEAVSYLLEKTGDIKGAFKIILKSVEEKIAEVEKIIHKKTDKIINIEDTVEWGSFQTTLVVIIQLCQRNCPKMKEQEREALWFPLFEALTIPQRKLKDSLAAYLPVFKDVTRYLLNSMMGYISVPSILEKIMKDPAYSGGKLGEIRDMIMGMLETYSYEQTLLHLTNNLLCSDLHNRLSNLHTIANKGYVSHSNKCSLCHKSFLSAGSQVIIFRCGHSFHASCIQDNEPNLKPLFGQEMWFCYLCRKPTKQKKFNINRGSEQQETDKSSTNSRTSQRASAYLQAANKQPLMKSTPSKSKVTLDHNQIQGLEYLRKLHRTNSRLAVLNELSKSDGDDSMSSPQRVNRANSSIFLSDDFSLRLIPSGNLSIIEEANEAARFKESAITGEPATEFTDTTENPSFVHWVADNVDHNIAIPSMNGEQVHKYLTPEDLYYFFQTKDIDAVPKYQLGNVVNEIKHEETSDENSPHITITIDTPETSYVIELQKNRKIIHDDLQEYKHLENCLFTGKVVHPTDGRVSLANCDGKGYRGYIFTPTKRIRVNPVPKYAANEIDSDDSANYHIFVDHSSKDIEDVPTPKRFKRQTNMYFLELNVEIHSSYGGDISNEDRLTLAFSDLNAIKNVDDIDETLDKFCALSANKPGDTSILITGSSAGRRDINVFQEWNSGLTEVLGDNIGQGPKKAKPVW
ncbi:Vacuolar protein sorting-associated protein 8 [Nymphon striatum]|nr:Vacuolar protein sorting-associated protein 8 [Nymphon striatum]